MMNTLTSFRVISSQSMIGFLTLRYFINHHIKMDASVCPRWELPKWEWHIVTVRMAERSNAPDSSAKTCVQPSEQWKISGLQSKAWVQIPLLTMSSFLIPMLPHLSINIIIQSQFIGNIVKSHWQIVEVFDHHGYGIYSLCTVRKNYLVFYDCVAVNVSLLTHFGEW